jgi:hypothetical protein
MGLPRLPVMGPRAPSVRRPAQVSPSRRPALLLPAQLDTQSAHHPHRGGLLLPAVRAGGRARASYKLRCPTELLLGRHSPRKLRAATAGAASCECHISRHRERRRHMAKPCCDHRDRTLCRCIDLPHVCQYPGAIGPTPTPSRLAFAQPLALATTMASPVAHTTGQRRPSQAPSQLTGKAGQTSNYPPTTQQPRPAPVARSKLSEAKKRQLAHSAYRSVLFEYDASHRQSATVPGRITATLPGRISYVHRHYR